MKFETRNPKAEGIPKSEFRNTTFAQTILGIRFSDLFRVSSFEARV